MPGVTNTHILKNPVQPIYSMTEYSKKKMTTQEFYPSDEYIEAVRDFTSRFPRLAIHHIEPLFFFKSQLPNWNRGLSKVFTLELETDKTIPKKYKKPVKMTPERLLLEAGIALTPATDLSDARAGYAMVRYGWYFRDLEDGKQLLLPEECNLFDFRLKTLLAEELGVGVTCFLMRERFELKHIADVSSAIEHKFVRKSSESKKEPDFCGLGKRKELTFIESKGTMKNRTKMRNGAKEGKLQIENVDTVRLPGSKNNYVVSSYFACGKYSKRKKLSTTKVTDPDKNTEGTEAPNELDMIVRCDYAKALRYANNDYLAKKLMDREDWDFRDTVMNNRKYVTVGFDPFGNAVSIESRVFKYLALNEKSNLFSSLAEIQIEQEGKDLNVLPNGIKITPPQKSTYLTE